MTKEKWKYMIYNLTCRECKTKFSITILYDFKDDIYNNETCLKCNSANIKIVNNFVAWIPV